MKKIISLAVVMCLFFSSVQGQNIADSLKIDTIQLYQHSIIIKYPANFYKSESSLTHGGSTIYYASQPSISLITVMEEANSKMDFGKNCIIIDKIESEYCYTERGVCLQKGYYRSDSYKKTRIKISYESVSECEHSLFNYILDSVIVKRYDNNAEKSNEPQ